MNNNAYQAPYTQNQVANHDEQIVTVKEWVITSLIMIIPLVNLVMLFVWAFGSGYKASKSNYFKAQLLIMAIIFGITIALTLLLAGIGFALQ